MKESYIIDPIAAENLVAYHRAILYWRQSGDLHNVWCISKHDGVTHVDIPKVNVKRITPHCKVVDIVDGECARKGESDGPVCVGLEWLSTGGDLESENHEWAVHFSDGIIIDFNEIFSMTLWQCIAMHVKEMPIYWWVGEECIK